MANPLRTLLVEDRLEDAATLLFELRKAGFDPHPVRVSTEVEYLAALDDEFDVVIATYELGRFNGMSALQLLRSRSQDVPFILISDSADEELAVQCIKAGAADYLTKDRPGRVGRAVAAALEESRARAAQRQSEALLRLQERALSAATNAVIICDARLPDLPIIFCNRAFEQITGYTAAEVLGRNCRFMQGPDTDPRAVAEIRKGLTEGREVHVLLKNYRKDGSSYWNELNISPVRDGELTHYIGICSDVTARKEAEERLQEREWLLVQGQSVAHLGSFDWDFTTQRITWSEELYRIFGIEPGTTVSLDLIRRFMPPEDQERLMQMLGHASSEGFVEFDYRILRPGGETRVVQLRGRRILSGGGQLVRLSGTVQDVTEARHAEAAVRESEARFRAIMDSAVDAVITMDGELRITGFNPSAERMFGRSFEEVAGLNICATILPSEQWKGNAPSFREFLESQSDSADSRRLELVARRANGEQFPAEFTISRTEGESGAIYTGFIRDLTITKAAEEAARAQTQETLDQQSALLALAAREPTDFASAVQSLLKTDAAILGVTRASYWCLQGDAGTSECEALYLTAEGRFVANDEVGSLPCESLQTNDEAALAITDTASDPRTAADYETHWKPRGAGSLLIVPVWLGGVTVGLLCHEHAASRSWTVEEQKFASSIANLISLALAERQRQQTAQALSQSEERFRATFDQAAVGIGHLSLDGRWIWVNRRLCEIFEEPREGLLTATGEIQPVHPQPFSDALQRLLSGEIDTFTSDQEFVRRNGSTVWLDVTLGLKRSDAGEPLYFIAALQNITDRKRAEERVLEQASLLDLTHDAIIVRDLDDRIEFWNHGAELLYGISGLEAIGKKESELIYSHGGEFEFAQGEVLEKGEWYGELRQQSRNDESEIIVDARWTLVRNDNGEPRSILAINTDITGRKTLEDQFLRAQRMESIGTLASGVAHDLNNILAPILMAIPMLRGELPEKVRESILDSMETSAQRGADIVRQVLTFARGVEGERVLLQPSHLLREMDKIAAETFPKTISIQSDLPGNLWTVTGDATQLHQVLMNLCVNARDAMPDGGTLKILAENFELDESSAAMTPGGRIGPYVMLQVSDTGMGIPRETLAKIFDPFFTTKEQGKGTGLGLSTVMGIVKSHGGFVKVTSDVGRGTTFQIFIPASTDSRLAEKEFTQPVIYRGNGELLLIVDDEPSIRQVTAAILRKHGYEALLASDGTDALATYAQRNGSIAAVLTDVVMPYIDGVALTRALKKLNPEVKIIASTGQGESARTGELQSLGVDSFLSKPYTTEKLLQAVHELLATPTLQLPAPIPFAQAV